MVLRFNIIPSASEYSCRAYRIEGGFSRRNVSQVCLFSVHETQSSATELGCPLLLIPSYALLCLSITISYKGNKVRETCVH